jgi:hypothetical protein
VTQPDYVPLNAADRVRAVERLPPAQPWRADRPSELAMPGLPVGPRLGSPGPDLGYGMKLARMLLDKIVVPEGESGEDAFAGCFAVGAKRASGFGRAPVIYDFQVAYTLWGWMAGAPADLVAFRRPLFQGASHEYEKQREIADRTPPETVAMAPADAAASLVDWRSLLITEARVPRAATPIDAAG